MPDPLILAARQRLAAFNHNSNLLLAGTEFAIRPQTPQLRAVAEVLRQCGAIIVPQPTPTTRVIWEPGNEILAELPHPKIGYPLVFADANPQGPPPSSANRAWADKTAQRPGTTRLDADTFRVDCREAASLAGDGAARVQWARRFMPVSKQVASQLGELVQDLRVGLSLILEPKTAVLALLLAGAGADVAVFSPANETDEAVASHLRNLGVKVFADSAASPQQERQLAEEFLDWHPQVLVDDGAHLIRRAHQKPSVMEHLLGAAEETTSGVRPLRAMAESDSLQIPVVAVNDARSKTLFDNRFGTGQTCVFAINAHLDAQNLDDQPLRWLVIGFGPVGAGVAQYAKAFGAEVVVAETDPVRALEARCAGYPTTPASMAVPDADVVVSATGVPRTITLSHLKSAKPGTVFAVAGGVPHEIEPGPWPPHVQVLAGGHGVNYTAAEGNPIEIMDLSFACQLSAIRQLLTFEHLPGVHPLDPTADKEVSQLALIAAGNAAGYPSEVDSTPASEAGSTPSSEFGVEMIYPSTDWRDDRYRDPNIAVYSANLVIPITAPHIVGGAIAVRDGKILHVGERHWVLQALHDESLEFTEQHWPGVITPGLVNAHTHLQYTDMAAVGSGHYLGFEDWAKAFDDVYDNEQFDWAASALKGAHLAIESGTTACADVVTDRGGAAALARAGMHGVAYWEVMGWSNEDWKERGREEAIVDLQRIPRMPGVGVSPHAPYSLEVQPLLDIPDLVRNLGMRLHIHLGEAHFERETWPMGARLEQKGEDWVRLGSPSFQALRRRGVGVSSTQFVDQLGVLGPDCHVAHGVYMSEDDRALLRARGTAVALCPRSNEVIGLDHPPIAAYLREGNQISVGTDSLSSAPSLDMLADVGHLYLLARQQQYAHPDLHERLLTAATLGGAGALGLRVGKMRVGQLAVGASADLAFFDVSTTVPADALAELVEAGAGTCRKTAIAGQIKFEATDA